jgi:hypothetical protein
MRRRWGLLLAAMSCASVLAQDATFFRDTKAKDLFNSGRIAVSGGPGGVARLKSLVLEGRSRIPGSNGSILDGTVEIRILLPDRFLRIDSGAFGKRLIGYAGTTPLNLVETADGRRIPAPADAGILQADRAELARLMLGLATYVSQEVPLTLQTRDTLVEMPGDADPLGVDAVSPKGFTARIVFDGKSRMPARLVFWGEGRTVLTMTLLDRRPTGGLRLPYHIVTAAGDRVVDELSFDEIVVNAPLSKTDFAGSW